MTAKPLIELDAAIAQFPAVLHRHEILHRKTYAGQYMDDAQGYVTKEDCLKYAKLVADAVVNALPTVTPDPLGAEWMRTEAEKCCQNEIDYEMTQHGEWAAAKLSGAEDLQEAILAIPTPTDDDLDRAALARPKVRAALEKACLMDMAFANQIGNRRHKGWSAIREFRWALDDLNTFPPQDDALAALTKEGE